MRDCDHCQIELSSLWDGSAADRAVVRSALLHLADCPACRSFVRDAGALGDLVHRAADGAPNRAAVGGSPWMLRRGIPLLGGLRAAVVALAVLGGAWIASDSRVGAPEARSSIEVELAGNRSTMDDTRFVELTTELLEGDHRYRRAMLEVLREIETQVPGLEASLDEMVELTDESGRTGTRPRV